VSKYALSATAPKEQTTHMRTYTRHKRHTPRHTTPRTTHNTHTHTHTTSRHMRHCTRAGSGISSRSTSGSTTRRTVSCCLGGRASRSTSNSASIYLTAHCGPVLSVLVPVAQSLTLQTQVAEPEGHHQRGGRRTRQVSSGDAAPWFDWLSHSPDTGPAGAGANSTNHKYK